MFKVIHVYIIDPSLSIESENYNIILNETLFEVDA